jgi:hypothetical protein
MTLYAVTLNMVWLMTKVGRNTFLCHNIFATVAKILRRQNNIRQRKYPYKMLNEFKIASFGEIFTIFLTIINVAFFSVGIFSKTRTFVLVTIISSQLFVL